MTRSVDDVVGVRDLDDTSGVADGDAIGVDGDQGKVGVLGHVADDKASQPAQRAAVRARSFRPRRSLASSSTFRGCPTIIKRVVPAYYLFATVLGFGLPLILMIDAFLRSDKLWFT